MSAELTSRDDLTNPKKITCTVSFNTSTPQLYLPPITIIYGTSIPKPRVITRTDCELVDWYVDRDLKKPYNFASRVVADIVLYAKWKFVPYQHEVYFCTNESSDPVLVEHGQAVKRPHDPKREGYVFLGWYLTDGPDETCYYIFDNPVTQGFVLFALWKEWKEKTPPLNDPIRSIQ
jgi:uncharacterized repeat protein (TIGR02543 family)